MKTCETMYRKIGIMAFFLAVAIFWGYSKNGNYVLKKLTKKILKFCKNNKSNNMIFRSLTLTNKT